MRQKDIDKIADIFEDEADWAEPSELEGMEALVGALGARLSWAQPDLDVSRLATLAGKLQVRQWPGATP